MHSIIVILIGLSIILFFGLEFFPELKRAFKKPSLPPADPDSSNPDAVLAHGLEMRRRGNHDEAKRFIRKAAEINSSAACMYMVELTIRDEEKIKWVTKAADLGDIDATIALVNAYNTGSGFIKGAYMFRTIKSISKSAYWRIKAAEAGHGPSMLVVAENYFTGCGVKQNHVEGLAWLYVADYKGSFKAKDMIRSGEKRLDSSVVHFAQERAQAILDLIAAGKTTTDSVDNGAGALPQPSSPAAVKPNRKPSGSGSGAIVSSEGHVVTAAHVVRTAAYIEVITTAGARPATVLSIDANNDVALLKVEGPFVDSIPIGRASEVRLGQTVSTIGFPNIGIQGQSPKVTQGMISGENGIQNDIRFWQISVPIQPGNSGGPLLNDKGELVGVIVATLGLKAIEITGTVPQNVNYAIKGHYLEPMLNVHKVANTAQPSIPSSFQDMIAQAQKASVLILVY